MVQWWFIATGGSGAGAVGLQEGGGGGAPATEREHRGCTGTGAGGGAQEGRRKTPKNAEGGAHSDPPTLCSDSLSVGGPPACDVVLPQHYYHLKKIITFVKTYRYENEN